MKYRLIALKEMVEKCIGNLITPNGIIEKILYKLYLNWITQRILTYKTGAIDSFVFFTDAHWGDNDRKTPFFCKEIAEKCDITKFVFGGDIITESYAEKENAICEIKSFFKSLQNSKYKIFPVIGNHDYNTYHQKNKFAVIDEKELKNILNECVQLLSSYEKLYYYFDFESVKIRYIFLNTSDQTYVEDQIPFICKTLIDTPAGFKIIVFGHIWVEWDANRRAYYTNDSTDKLLRIFDKYNDRDSYKNFDFTESLSFVRLIVGGTYIMSILFIQTEGFL